MLELCLYIKKQKQEQNPPPALSVDLFLCHLKPMERFTDFSQIGIRSLHTLEVQGRFMETAQRETVLHLGPLLQSGFLSTDRGILTHTWSQFLVSLLKKGEPLIWAKNIHAFLSNYLSGWPVCGSMYALQGHTDPYCEPTARCPLRQRLVRTEHSTGADWWQMAPLSPHTGSACPV